jgi:hypothetical protein
MRTWSWNHSMLRRPGAAQHTGRCSAGAVWADSGSPRERGDLEKTRVHGPGTGGALSREGPRSKDIASAF